MRRRMKRKRRRLRMSEWGTRTRSTKKRHGLEHKELSIHPLTPNTDRSIIIKPFELNTYLFQSILPPSFLCQLPLFSLFLSTPILSTLLCFICNCLSPFTRIVHSSYKRSEKRVVAARFILEHSLLFMIKNYFRSLCETDKVISDGRRSTSCSSPTILR